MPLSPGVQMFSGDEINTLITYPPIRTVTPLTGTTITMNADEQYLLVAPAGTIAALTILLPPVNPRIGQFVSISFSQIVTALTIQTSAGSNVINSATSGDPGLGQEYRRTSPTQWRRWS